jgi:hypothetical protein
METSLFQKIINDQDVSNLSTTDWDILHEYNDFDVKLIIF